MRTMSLSGMREAEAIQAERDRARRLAPETFALLDAAILLQRRMPGWVPNGPNWQRYAPCKELEGLIFNLGYFADRGQEMGEEALRETAERLRRLGEKA